MKPDGLYSYTRLLHGTTDVVTYLQSLLTLTLPQELKTSLFLWLDDCLLHSASITEFPHYIRSFLSYGISFNFKLKPAKCILFTRSVRWCGRVTSCDEIRHDPACLNTLLGMHRPSTGGQLQQFLCALQWLRSSIHQFQTLVSPLHTFLEAVYTHIGKRTKRAVICVFLDTLRWDFSLTQLFHKYKNAIAKSVTSAHRDESKRLCIYTDASDTH